MIDWNVAMESVNADQQLLADVVGILQTELPQLNRELRSAVASGESTAIAEAAHKLKGSVRFLGPSVVYDSAERIELLEPMDLGVANQIVESLSQSSDELSKELADYIANAKS